MRKPDQTICFSNIEAIATWDKTKGTVFSVTSPFNMEEILRADETLFSIWQEKPFIFDVNDSNEIIITYIDPTFKKRP